MAKNKKKPTNEIVEMEKSDEVLTVVDTKKKAKAEAKNAKTDTSKKVKQSKKKAKGDKQKRNFGKEVISELKKVNWPTFKKSVQTNWHGFGCGGCFYACSFGH